MKFNYIEIRSCPSEIIKTLLLMQLILTFNSINNFNYIFDIHYIKYIKANLIILRVCI